MFDKTKQFTEIELHKAVHGLVVEADTLFHSLRLTMFLNDTVIFVCDHSVFSPKLFILFEKNVLFYGIIKSKQLSDELIKEPKIKNNIESESISTGKKKYIKEYYDEFLKREKKR
ncbi:MAG: hypothetical protein K6G11_09060 [Lachnospiraceae bacterium]|nr:hypothetical protein [Lachnospiraceae bacterium]